MIIIMIHTSKNKFLFIQRLNCSFPFFVHPSLIFVLSLVYCLSNIHPVACTCNFGKLTPFLPFDRSARSKDTCALFEETLLHPHCVVNGIVKKRNTPTESLHFI